MSVKIILFKYTSGIENNTCRESLEIILSLKKTRFHVNNKHEM